MHQACTVNWLCDASYKVDSRACQSSEGHIDHAGRPNIWRKKAKLVAWLWKLLGKHQICFAQDKQCQTNYRERRRVITQRVTRFCTSMHWPWYVHHRHYMDISLTGNTQVSHTHCVLPKQEYIMWDYAQCRWSEIQYTRCVVQNRPGRLQWYYLVWNTPYAFCSRGGWGATDLGWLHCPGCTESLVPCECGSGPLLSSCAQQTHPFPCPLKDAPCVKSQPTWRANSNRPSILQTARHNMTRCSYHAM